MTLAQSISSALSREEARKPVLSEVTLVLPMPPTTNHLYANVAGKGRVPSKDYLSWRRVALNEWYAQRINGRFAGAVRLSMLVQRKRGADLSNRIKAAEDFLVHVGLISDDRHVEAIDLAWSDDVVGVQITVRAA